MLDGLSLSPVPSLSRFILSLPRTKASQLRLSPYMLSSQSYSLVCSNLRRVGTAGCQRFSHLDSIWSTDSFRVHEPGMVQ